MLWIDRPRREQFAAEETDAHRLANGPQGWLDRYGEWVVWSSRQEAGGRGTEIGGLSSEGSSLVTRHTSLAAEVRSRFGFVPRGWLMRELAREAREQQPARLVEGEEPGVVEVREWGVRYAVEPAGGYSAGLFLDQRMNRRRVRDVRPRRMLNLFAYTCSFSVCAALGGGTTLSVDVAKRALARGRENFARNGVETGGGGHRFVADDAAKVVPRLVRRGEKFDLIVLDPPTFGRADGRVFRLERDLPGLVGGCFALLEPGGFLLVSCNYAAWSAASLRAVCEAALEGVRFEIVAGETIPEIPGGAVSWWVRRV